MGTDWFIKVKRRKGVETGQSEEECSQECLKCPCVIREKPKSGSGIFRPMCGVRVGNVFRAAKLDNIRQNLTDTKGFIELAGCPSAQKVMLEQVKRHAEKTGWNIKGFSKAKTIVWLDMLIEFCKRAEGKSLTSGHGHREVKGMVKKKFVLFQDQIKDFSNKGWESRVIGVRGRIILVEAEVPEENGGTSAYRRDETIKGPGRCSR